MKKGCPSEITAVCSFWAEAATGRADRAAAGQSWSALPGTVTRMPTLDGVPYIGPYSKRTRGLYVATGFNKWGMTSSMAAAEVLTDLVLDRKNPCTELFSPSRTMLRPQLAVNALESSLGLLTPTVPRCPHMGCALKYNAAEHSWDCPCHGSRFGEDGTLIDNPATDDRLN